MADQQVSFEQAFRELEETVRKLETGALSLEESVALFQRGTELAALCNQRLDQAELRVRQLLPADAGELQAAPFADWARDSEDRAAY